MNNWSNLRTTLLVITGTIFITGCSSASFSGGSKKPTVTQSTPQNTEVKPTKTDINTGNETDTAGSNIAPNPEVADQCVSAKQAGSFSCDNIDEAKGGLSDEIVGVRLVLLKDKLPFFLGQSTCLLRGGELIAGGDFFVDKITECMHGDDSWFDSQSSFVYANISMAAIQSKFGQTVVDSCMKNGADPSLQTVEVERVMDPSIPMDIYCVFRI